MPGKYKLTWTDYPKSEEAWEGVQALHNTASHSRCGSSAAGNTHLLTSHMLREDSVDPANTRDCSICQYEIHAECRRWEWTCGEHSAHLICARKMHCKAVATYGAPAYAEHLRCPQCRASFRPKTDAMRLLRLCHQSNNTDYFVRASIEADEREADGVRG